jgi:hypothetical protein
MPTRSACRVGKIAITCAQVARPRHAILPTLFCARHRTSCRSCSEGSAFQAESALTTELGRGRAEACNCAAGITLRRPHDHHRDFRARMRTKTPPHTRAATDQDRYLMMSSRPIDDRSRRHQSRWPITSNAAGCDPALDSTPRAPQSGRQPPNQLWLPCAFT